METEKIFFKSGDGLKLCGILTKPDNESKSCIVLCHGITSSKEEDGIFTDLAHELVDTGFHVFRFDFRAHGESEGEQINMTVSGEKKDLEAAMKLLEEKEYETFGLLAASFAGGAVPLYCEENPQSIKALVLWNALIDYSSWINAKSPWVEKYLGAPAFERAEKQGYTKIGSEDFKMGRDLMRELKILKPFQSLENLDIPMLFVHGSEDSDVPYEDSVKYARIFNSKLITIEGADHGFHDNKKDSEKANKATINFFLENLK